MERLIDDQGSRRTRGVAALAVAAVLVLGAGCSSGGSSTSPESGASSPSTEGGAVTSPDSTGAVDPGLQPYIDIAVADLAARLQRDPGDVATRSAVLIVWPDTSLGCPAPGMEYAQVATDGAQIVLEVDGTTYDYHAGGDTTPFLCDPKSGPAPTTTSG